MQVMEAERKLKILSVISLRSERHSDFTLKDFKYNLSNELSQNLEVPENFYDVFSSFDDVLKSQMKLSLL